MGRHLRLSLNAIDAVVDAATKRAQRQHIERERVVGPEDRILKTKPTVGQLQPPSNQQAIQPLRQGTRGPWQHQGRPDPEARLHLPRGTGHTPKPLQDAGQISKPLPRWAKPEGFHIKDSVAQGNQADGGVLLVGPEGVVPVCGGQNDEIGHGRPQALSNWVISRKLSESWQSVSKSPAALIRPFSTS